jgi:spermidine/putrescine transport system substrate-binding protein
MKVRNLMKGNGGLCGFMAGMLALVLLFACLPAFAFAVEKRTYEKYVSSLPEGYEPVPRECFEQAIEDRAAITYNWAEWWPEKELYGRFSKEFGIEVRPDYFSTNDEMMAKFKLNPDIGYDIAYSGHKSFMQLTAFGVRMREINHDWVPNVNKYLGEEFKNLPFDVGYRYQLPFAYYLFGYGINTKYVDDSRIPSWAVVLKPDEKYAGKVTMYDGMWRTIGAALKYLGYSLNTDDEGELIKAKELLLKQKPRVMAYDSWPKRLILEENAWIVSLWVGDFLNLHRDNKNIKAVLPAEGTEIGYADLIIPKNSPHPAAAHLFMNYLFRPDINALLLEAIAYAPVHTASSELLSEEMLNWPGVTISDEYFKKCEFINHKAFTGKGLELRAAIWEELKR